MDTSRLSQGQTIAGIGGVVLFVSLFLSWASGFPSSSAFGTFSSIDIIMLIVALAAIAYAAAVATESSANVPNNAGLILSGLGLVVVGWALGWDLEQPFAGIGSWLALFAGVAIAYGGYVSDRSVSGPRV